MIIKSIYKNYEVKFTKSFSFVDELLKYKNRFVIIDQNIYKLYQKELKAIMNTEDLYILDSVEENKSIQEVLKIADYLVNLKSKRNTRMISVGGGIVQDVTGFLSNIIYRGIGWTWIPTTLLAQTDSCIGSKTSINYGLYKNLFGTFYPPDEIYVNSLFLNTLDKKEYLSGLGEIFKCSIMRGYESFQESESRLPEMLDLNYDVLNLEVEKALDFKKRVIEIDEFDTGYRNIMNYGHTFGHALESVSRFHIPHGQCVSIGIIIANDLACGRGLITQKRNEQIKAALFRIIQNELLKREYFDAEAFIAAMKKDKKFNGTTHACILLNEKENQVQRYSDVMDEEIAKALQVFVKERGLSC